jgi:hypothetical protein
MIISCCGGARPNGEQIARFVACGWGEHSVVLQDANYITDGATLANALVKLINSGFRSN